MHSKGEKMKGDREQTDAFICIQKLFCIEYKHPIQIFAFKLKFIK